MNTTAVGGSVGTVRGETLSLDDIINRNSDGFDEVEDEAVLDDDSETATESEEPETGSTPEVEDEDDMSAETEPDEEAETAPGSEARGIALAMEQLDNLDPEAAKAVKDLQTAYGKSQTQLHQTREEIRAQERERAEFEANKREVETILADYKQAMKEEEEPTAAEVDALEAKMDELGLDETQKEVYRELSRVGFESEAKKRGLLSRSDLDREAAQKTQKDFISTANKTAAEKYGEAFGKVDANGSLVMDSRLNVPDGPYKAQIAEVRNRLVSGGQGLVWEDIYRIAQYDADVEAAYQRGLGEKATGGRLAAKGRAGGTVNGSSPSANGRPIFYDRKKDNTPSGRDASIDKLIAWSMRNSK